MKHEYTIFQRTLKQMLKTFLKKKYWKNVLWNNEKTVKKRLNDENMKLCHV